MMETVTEKLSPARWYCSRNSIISGQKDEIDCNTSLRRRHYLKAITLYICAIRINIGSYIFYSQYRKKKANTT